VRCGDRKVFFTSCCVMVLPPCRRPFARRFTSSARTIATGSIPGCAKKCRSSAASTASRHGRGTCPLPCRRAWSGPPVARSSPAPRARGGGGRTALAMEPRDPAPPEEPWHAPRRPRRPGHPARALRELDPAGGGPELPRLRRHVGHLGVAQTLELVGEGATLG